MKLSKRNKTLLTIIGISIVMFVAILNLGSIFKVLKSGFALAQPVLVGCAIAFILNVFLNVSLHFRNIQSSLNTYCSLCLHLYIN